MSIYSNLIKLNSKFVTSRCLPYKEQKQTDNIRGRPVLVSLPQAYTQYAFKNVNYDALHFHMESLKINIFNVLLWERRRGSQKEYSVYGF